MKLKIDEVCYEFNHNFAGYAIFEHSWIWGWKRYDNIICNNYRDAVIHMANIKMGEG